MRAFLWGLFDVVGAAALLMWAMLAFGIPVGFPAWRCVIGIVLMFCAKTQLDKERT